ncbi:hypothetical protein RFI_06415 [Reticulomyxa filosa]|uniref:Uncharacterized protein n=1 Tax=Reticulomyxa filosa TaxID=46433 RepID=X6NXZ9_RETFI|nr:hypothetical protein RFI_06415 [Reticulomyxa filosa]|eukprot:ETO30704.1 hypothetical protein RFI_06415 [Reticulomyxa filosa]
MHSFLIEYPTNKHFYHIMKHGCNLKLLKENNNFKIVREMYLNILWNILKVKHLKYRQINNKIYIIIYYSNTIIIGIIQIIIPSYYCGIVIKHLLMNKSCIIQTYMCTFILFNNKKRNKEFMINCCNNEINLFAIYLSKNKIIGENQYLICNNKCC